MATKRKPPESTIPPITEIVVKGFKAHRDQLNLRLAPLTVLSGANSSGKSSVMQALLLLKQTADSDTNRGALRVDGPHVGFEEFDDFAWHGGSPSSTLDKEVQIGLTAGLVQVLNTYTSPQRKSISLDSTEFKSDDKKAGLSPQDSYRVQPTQPFGDLLSPREADQMIGERSKGRSPSTKRTNPILARSVSAQATKGFLLPTIRWEDEYPPDSDEDLLSKFNWHVWRFHVRLALPIQFALEQILHLPGHRGNPERLYPYTVAAASDASAPFSDLYAGVLLAWTESGEEGTQNLKQVADIMKAMGLAWKVEAIRQTTSHIKIQVSRTPTPSRAGARDLVSLPDVGFGVSQILPVVVALVHAQPGQLVYIEQPEIHLHPKAQEALAEAIVDAVKRGVRFVVETHSESILLTFQTAIARGDLPASDVLFHWFKRGEQGESIVESKVPDHAGRYGDLPFDFGDTLMDLQAKYIRAAHQAEKKHQKAKAAPNA